MQDFRRLWVWQKAHTLTVAVHRLTSGFPPHERFALASQMRRAASSIGANVAEGCGRRTPADMRRFVDIAIGSSTELLNHLMVARDLDLIDEATLRRLEHDAFLIRRALHRLAERLAPARSAARSAAEDAATRSVAEHPAARSAAEHLRGER